MNLSRRRAPPSQVSAVLLACLIGAPSLALAQPVAGPPSAVSGLPAVPTTRILAIGRLTAGATLAARRDVMPLEVRQTLGLYLDGTIDQWYFKQDGTGVVFILNTADLARAQSALESLPMGRAGLMTFELIPLGPLSPLALLGAAGRPAARD